MSCGRNLAGCLEKQKGTAALELQEILTGSTANCELEEAATC